MSRASEQLFGFRHSLEKALESDVFEEEQFHDILQALEKVPIDVDVLKQTGIVQPLQTLKKKYSEKEIGIKAKDLLARWKKDCLVGASTREVEAKRKVVLPMEVNAKVEASRHIVKVVGGDKKSGSTTTSTSFASSSSSQASSSGAALSLRTKSEDEEWDDDGYFKNLAVTRQKILKLLSENLQASAPTNIANFVATNVEASLHNLHHAERDNRNYLAKAKSLMYNLKTNERLRDDVISGAIPAHVLVTLNAKDMATEDLKELREETTKNATLARRADLYEIKRAEILAANGIDPNKGGEFVCRKCKGSKTTHYSLQTRSSDEPMTVFVCCLTCGNRWRTQ
eukprot:scaffold1263_cov170-Ochromonas_danica.AAC.9